MAYWLMKSEPETYSIDHLAADGVNMWEGCRNYTVRNFFRDRFKVGDLSFFYHSVTDPTGIVGVMQVVRGGYTDPTQFDANSEYFDPKAPTDGSRWMAVDVEFVQKFPRVISLAELKANSATASMQVCMRGQRLSVMPVEPSEWDAVMEMLK